MKVKKIVSIFMIFLLLISSTMRAASVVDNDGSAFITKSEFDSLKSNFQAQIDSYNLGIDSKIDSAIASYLSGIKISKEEDINNKLVTLIKPYNHYTTLTSFVNVAGSIYNATPSNIDYYTPRHNSLDLSHFHTAIEGGVMYGFTKAGRTQCHKYTGSFFTEIENYNNGIFVNENNEIESITKYNVYITMNLATMVSANAGRVGIVCQLHRYGSATDTLMNGDEVITPTNTWDPTETYLFKGKSGYMATPNSSNFVDTYYTSDKQLVDTSARRYTDDMDYNTLTPSSSNCWWKIGNGSGFSSSIPLENFVVTTKTLDNYTTPIFASKWDSTKGYPDTSVSYGFQNVACNNNKYKYINTSRVIEILQFQPSVFMYYDGGSTEPYSREVFIFPQIGKNLLASSNANINKLYYKVINDAFGIKSPLNLGVPLIEPRSNNYTATFKVKFAPNDTAPQENDFHCFMAKDKTSGPGLDLKACSLCEITKDDGTVLTSVPADNNFYNVKVKVDAGYYLMIHFNQHGRDYCGELIDMSNTIKIVGDES